MKKETGLDRYNEILLGGIFMLLAIICAVAVNNTVLQYIPYWWYTLIGVICWELWGICIRVCSKLWFPFLRDEDDDDA